MVHYSTGYKSNAFTLTLNNNAPEGRNEITARHENVKALFGTKQNTSTILQVISERNTAQ